MVIVHVEVQVKPEHVAAFVQATEANARASLGEPGVLRFDVLRAEASAERFVLVEVYRDAAAPAAHKETEHYKTWRATVEPMMAAPRTSARYVEVFPTAADGWSSRR